MFTLLPWGDWAWQEGKSSLKGNVEQLFSIVPEEKVEEIKSTYSKHQEGFMLNTGKYFLNVLTFRMAF